MSYIEDAFREVVADGKIPSKWYVCLCSTQRCYGGPEEGGWWYDATDLHEYAEYADIDTANAVAEKVRERAAELSLADRRLRDEGCLRQMEWLEARGLDADYLPEPNGHEEYFVSVTETLPVFDNQKPRYE